MTDKYIPVKIAGVGYSLPEAVVTNDDLTKLYETSDEWIYTRTGIKERRLVSGDEDAIDLGFDAAKKALEKSGIKPEELDLIVAASSAPPQLYPAIACHIQSRLGIETDIPAFDITAACSGLIYGMQVAKGFINSGIYKNVLIVATDNNSRYLDWSDRGTSILFGDGAGCAVLRAEECDGSLADRGVIDTLIYSDGRYAPELCSTGGPSTNHEVGYITMNGREVFRHAAVNMADVSEEILAKNGVSMEQVDWLVPHQANIRILEATAKRLGIPMEKVISTVGDHANTSAASIPLALAESYKSGKIKEGQLLLLPGMGAGFTWGAGLIRL